MLDGNYKKRLGEDLPRWREKGWVTADGASAILASLNEKSGPGFGLAAVIAVLGTLLIGFGIFAFVGANWDYMPRIFRFGLLVALLGAAYAVAAVLHTKNLPRFADAAVLLGGLIYAAAIALVGQTYHMAGDFADAVLLWLAGATLAAVFTRSVSGTVAALAGAAYWIWLTTFENDAAPHWGGLVAILALGVWATVLDSRLARSAAILALGFWIVVTVASVGDRFDWPDAGMLTLLSCIGLAIWAAGLVLSLPAMPARLRMLGSDVMTPALAGFLLAAGIMQVALSVSDVNDNQVWAGIAVGALAVAVLCAAFALQRGALRFLDLAAVAGLGAALIAVTLWVPADDFTARLVPGLIVILGALWWISLGHAGHPVGSKIGLFAFGAEVLYLYGVTLGTLIDTALAFLVGGVLFIALAVLLFRLDKRLAARTAEAAS